MVEVRKGMPPVQLDEQEFKRRFLARFYDPAFEPLQTELERIADAAWDDPEMDRIYDDLRAEFDLVDRYRALELKLRTVQYGLQHGYCEIRTANDAANAPMLHINAALGFRKQAAIVILERRL